MAAYIGSVLVDVFMSYCSGVAVMKSSCKFGLLGKRNDVDEH